MDPHQRRELLVSAGRFSKKPALRNITFFYAGKPGKRIRNAGTGFASHTASSAALRNGAAAWPTNHRTDGGAITLRGLEIYVEGGLADEGENGSQPNN